MSGPVVAIDGPAASGKGTLARRLALHLGCPHLDTGLLYRAVARALLDRETPLEDQAAAVAAATALAPEHLDPASLRGFRMGEAASVISVYPDVRRSLLAFQRRFAGQGGGAVLDGRDIGTVVCPEADVKLYVTASPEERARRRYREVTAAGERTTFESVLADILRRDRRDAERAAAPLRRAPDAHELDTTLLDADAAFAAAREVVDTHLARPSERRRRDLHVSR